MPNQSIPGAHVDADDSPLTDLSDFTQPIQTPAIALIDSTMQGDGWDDNVNLDMANTSSRGGMRGGGAPTSSSRAPRDSAQASTEPSAAPLHPDLVRFMQDMTTRTKDMDERHKRMEERLSDLESRRASRASSRSGDRNEPRRIESSSQAQQNIHPQVAPTGQQQQAAGSSAPPQASSPPWEARQNLAAQPSFGRGDPPPIPPMSARYGAPHPQRGQWRRVSDTQLDVLPEDVNQPGKIPDESSQLESQRQAGAASRSGATPIVPPQSLNVGANASAAQRKRRDRNNTAFDDSIDPALATKTMLERTGKDEPLIACRPQDLVDLDPDDTDIEHWFRATKFAIEARCLTLASQEAKEYYVATALSSIPSVLHGEAREHYSLLSPNELTLLSQSLEAWRTHFVESFLDPPADRYSAAVTRSWKPGKEKCVTYVRRKLQMLDSADPHMDLQRKAIFARNGIPGELRFHMTSPEYPTITMSKLLAEARVIDQVWDATEASRRAATRSSKSSSSKDFPQPRASNARQRGAESELSESESSKNKKSPSKSAWYDPSTIGYEVKDGKRTRYYVNSKGVKKFLSSSGCHICGGDHFRFEHDTETADLKDLKKKGKAYFLRTPHTDEDDDDDSPPTSSSSSSVTATETESREPPKAEAKAHFQKRPALRA